MSGWYKAGSADLFECAQANSVHHYWFSKRWLLHFNRSADNGQTDESDEYPVTPTGKVKGDGTIAERLISVAPEYG
ncbi:MULTISPECIES: hypothetical protein [unclassified Haladaptatus]|uniref:hypothetical protein n=1 Tax=unclassified Haladaptatus TaxID=2622732 RepID=UPI00209BF5FE|nr:MULTISPECIES: hypothetical protein [unclassified Haladaptatus]MCO8245439.1 hypothetical protein [Haladaptatus sp. AB643]MCO8256550.1 hypothetical protein [Haladaptatus sp. AB618]